METKTKQIVVFLVLPLLAAAVLINFQNRQASRFTGRMTVEFFDVGQGDSFLITTINGSQVLVDAGPGSAVTRHLSRSMPPFDRVIELAVISHPHTDHIEGFIQVFERYEVEKVLLPNVKFNSPQHGEFLRRLAEEGAEVAYAQQGQRWTLDQGTVLDIMHPRTPEQAAPRDSAGVNDSSIVAMLVFGRTRFLLTGDSGTDIENPLLAGFDLDAEVLKVGHHGSRHSTSRRFLEEVTPEIAVIQVGKNNYGHPAPEVLDRLAEIGAQTYRNDEHGTVTIVSDGFRVDNAGQIR